MRSTSKSTYKKAMTGRRSDLGKAIVEYISDTHTKKHKGRMIIMHAIQVDF